VCDDVDLPTVDTVTLGDITDDRIDEGDILFTRPTIGRPVWQSGRIGDDRFTLTLESHIVLYHGITIRATMDRDDEFCRIGGTVTRRNSENIASSFSAYGYLMRS
jgi:hypothetical protein